MPAGSIWKLSDGERTFNYSTFSKPTDIATASHKTLFKYGPSRNRFYREDQQSFGVERTWYLGSVEKVHTHDNKILWRRSVSGGGIQIIETDASYAQIGKTKYRYILKDHLGSTDVIVRDDGVSIELMKFDPWGLSGGNEDYTNSVGRKSVAAEQVTTNRGFTGHEMLQAVGVIHMNGRIYDPRLGRFLQADPFIQSPTDSQSYNRYTYLRNNPLNATDPTGYFANFVIGVAIGYMFQQLGEVTRTPWLSLVGSMLACGKSMGFAGCAGGSFGSTYGATGSLNKSTEAALITYFQAKIADEIGTHF